MKMGKWVRVGKRSCLLWPPKLSLSQYQVFFLFLLSTFSYETNCQHLAWSALHFPRLFCSHPWQHSAECKCGAETHNMHSSSRTCFKTWLTYHVHGFLRTGYAWLHVRKSRHQTTWFAAVTPFCYERDIERPNLGSLPNDSPSTPFLDDYRLVLVMAYGCDYPIEVYHACDM